MTRRTIIPIGPYHALQEEPEFFKLHVEGETVVALDIELGYNHRGIEKISETKTFEETVFLVERICGICSTSHPIACVQAIEDAGLTLAMESKGHGEDSETVVLTARSTSGDRTLQVLISVGDKETMAAVTFSEGN